MTKSEKKDLVLKGKLPARAYENIAFRTFRSVMSYIGCIVIALGVTYYLDGAAGIMITTALICALVISLILTIAVRGTIDVNITADKTMLVKGESLKCKVKLSNKILVPAPVIEIEADCSPQLTIETSHIYKGALAGRATNVIKIPMTAHYSGKAHLMIKRVTLTDYLGIFSFRLKVPEDQLSFNVAIYPNIPDAAVQTDFLKTTNKFSNEDDEEEESDEISMTSTGMPGYEHRQYFPGDPIKKINWKLSSKRDIYMIRLDEQIRGAGQMFFLDCPLGEDNEYTLKVRDNVIEGALTMLSMIVHEGREATFFFPSEGLWLSNDIHDQKDILRLQELLSGFSPSEPPTAVPAEIVNEGKTPIVFSTAVRDNDAGLMKIIAQCPEALVITSQAAMVPLLCPDMWTISDEFEFRKQNV